MTHWKIAVAITMAVACFAALAVLGWERLRRALGDRERQLEAQVRLSRDLHDALLQGLQGLVFRLEAVRNMLPDRASGALDMLEATLQRADDALAEGRQGAMQLQDAGENSDNLVDAMHMLGLEFARGPDGRVARFAVLEEGHPRVLAPLVRDEIYRVAREAVRNAMTHASASAIEVELGFGRDDFSLRIRDDGIGMTGVVLSDVARRGLPDMRARAAGVGGRLTIWARPGAGTEVELTVPNRVAFAR